jgi:hypothetical protein
MSLHQTGYNYHPNDRVWFFDQTLSAFKEGSLYQVEVKLYKKPTSAVEKKLFYLVALDDSPTTLRVSDSDLYINTAGGLVPSPPVPRYNVAYGFDPDEMVWVIDRINNGVKYGKVYQSEIKIHKETETTSHAKIIYYISFNDSTGTVIAREDEVFNTSNEAWAALGIVIGPTPTPTLPPDATPVPGGGNLTTVSRLNGDSVTLYKGQPVYINQTNGTVARSASDATALTFLGFVYDDSIPVGGSGRIITEGTINITTVNWNNILEGGGSLMAGKRYYLAGLGKLSAIAPTSGYSKQVGMAASDTELDIRIGYTIKL